MEPDCRRFIAYQHEFEPGGWAESNVKRIYGVDKSPAPCRNGAPNWPPNPSACMWHPKNERALFQFGDSTRGGEPGGPTTALPTPGKHRSNTNSSLAETKRARHPNAMEPLQLSNSTLGRGAQQSDHRPNKSRETPAAAPDTPRLRSTRVKAWGPAPEKPGERTPPAEAEAAEYASSASKSHTTRAGWQAKAG